MLDSCACKSSEGWGPFFFLCARREIPKKPVLAMGREYFPVTTSSLACPPRHNMIRTEGLYCVCHTGICYIDVALHVGDILRTGALCPALPDAPLPLRQVRRIYIDMA